MAAYVELPVGDDDYVIVEVSGQGVVRAGAGDVVGRTCERFDQAVAQVNRALDLLGERAADLATADVLESGKTLADCQGEISRALAATRYQLEIAPDLLRAERKPDSGWMSCLSIRQGAVFPAARHASGTVLTWGGALPGDGYFIEPTVIDRPEPDSAIIQEEIFGPVVALLSAADLDEAITWRRPKEQRSR